MLKHCDLVCATQIKSLKRKRDNGVTPVASMFVDSNKRSRYDSYGKGKGKRKRKSMNSCSSPGSSASTKTVPISHSKTSLEHLSTKPFFTFKWAIIFFARAAISSFRCCYVLWCFRRRVGCIQINNTKKKPEKIGKNRKQSKKSGKIRKNCLTKFEGKKSFSND